MDSELRRILRTVGQVMKEIGIRRDFPITVRFHRKLTSEHAELENNFIGGDPDSEQRFTNQYKALVKKCFPKLHPTIEIYQECALFRSFYMPSLTVA